MHWLVYVHRRQSSINWKYLSAGFLVAIIILASTLTYLYIYRPWNSEVEPIVLLLDWLPQGRYVPIYVALDKGFYRENGIDISLVSGKGSTFATQQVDAGQVDLGLCSVETLILSRAAGLNVKGIMTMLHRSTAAIHYKKNVGIAEPKDLEGKKLGVTALSSFRQTGPIFMRANGANYSEVVEVIVDQSVKTSQFVAGEFDATHGYIDSDYIIQKAVVENTSIETDVFIFSEWGLTMYGWVAIATDDTIENRSDLLSRYIDATERGIRYAVEHPEEGVEILLKYEPILEEDIVSLQWQQSMNFLQSEPPYTTIDEALMNDTIDIVAEAYNLSPRPVKQDIYTLEIP